MSFPHDLESSPDQPLHRLSLAFAVSVARTMVQADGVYDANELQSLNEMFPNMLLRDFGFVDEDGQFNDDFVTANREALATLPEALDTNRKLEILSTLYRMASADGEFHESEFHLLQQAAARLSLSPEKLASHISRYPSAAPDAPPVRK